MKHLTRRSVSRMAGAALATPTISRFARAAEISWKLGHVAPLDTPLHQHLLEAAEAIAKRSDGKMELTIVGEGKAGIQSGLLDQVRHTGLEMTVTTCAQLAPLVGVCEIPSTGFLFGAYADVWPAMDGALGQLLRSQIATQLGVEVLEKIWDFGFRNITNSVHPIQTAADLAGLKIRTQIDTDQMEMFRALDAIPVVITLPYLRTALEHHQIDGQEGMLAVVEFARLNEVQPFCTMTRHIWDGLWLCINTKAWKALPERYQRIVANTLNGSAQRQREDNAKMEDTIRASLTKYGMKFIDSDPGNFRDQLRKRGYYAGVKTKLGDTNWAILQKATGVAA